MIRSVSSALPDLSHPRTQIALGGAAVGAVVLALCVQIGTGNLTLAVALLGLLAAPFAIVAALKWPYVFPYGLYIMLVPFDNMLKIGGVGTLTKMLGMLAIAAIAAHAFVVRRAARPPRALWLWVVFLLWSAVTAMWSPDLPGGLVYLQSLASLVVLYGVLSTSPLEERDLRAICAFIVVGGVLASLYGIYLLHNSPQMAGDYGRLMINVGDRRIDPNHFANSLLAPIALAFVGLLSARKPLTLLGSLAALAILVSGVLISLSRETLLGCVVMIAVIVLLSRRRLAGILIGVPLLVIVPLLVPAIGVRMAEAFTTGGAGRTALWHIAWVSFTQKPFLGWGVSGSVEAYQVNLFSAYQLHPAGWVISPHNTPLQIAVENGIIGLVIFALAYGAMAFQLRLVPGNDRLTDLRDGLTAAFVALVFVGFFIDFATYKYLWLVLGTIAQLRVVALLRARAPAAAPHAVIEVPVAAPVVSAARRIAAP